MSFSRRRSRIRNSHPSNWKARRIGEKNSPPGSQARIAVLTNVYPFIYWTDGRDLSAPLTQ